MSLIRLLCRRRQHLKFCLQQSLMFGPETTPLVLRHRDGAYLWALCQLFPCVSAWFPRNRNRNRIPVVAAVLLTELVRRRPWTMWLNLENNAAHFGVGRGDSSVARSAAAFEKFQFVLLVIQPPSAVYQRTLCVQPSTNVLEYRLTVSSFVVFDASAHLVSLLPIRKFVTH